MNITTITIIALSILKIGSFYKNIQIKAYCPCIKCCGKWADGKVAWKNKNAYKPGLAVNPKKIPYGTKVFISNFGVLTADDTGPWEKKSNDIVLEIRFPKHSQAVKWGNKYKNIIILRKEEAK